LFVCEYPLVARQITMQKLIFDARTITFQYTGLGRYTASLLFALLDNASPDICRITVLLEDSTDLSDNSHVKRLKPYVDSDRCEVRLVPTPAISLVQQLKLPPIVNAMGADHYFYPHFDYPVGIRIPTTFVVHDLLPLVVPDYVQKMAWAKKVYFREMLCLAAHRAQHCIAVSDATRRDLAKLIGDKLAQKITVAPEGPTLSASSAEMAASWLRIRRERPFLMYVGDRRPHKNLRRIIDLFRLLREQHGYPGELLLIGSPQNHDFNVDAYIANMPDVKVIGNVTDAELGALYSHADGLVFLSRYEGFGLPVVEAAQHGCRVIVSDGGSLPEVAPRNACILPNDMPLSRAASALAHYLDAPLAQLPDAYLQGYSWQAAAQVIFPYCHVAGAQAARSHDTAMSR
jgi:glycosyltransferase involved in cell wall biosynthesis